MQEERGVPRIKKGIISVAWVMGILHCIGMGVVLGQSQIRGNIAQEVYELSNSAASCSRSSFNALYESHVCPLSFAVWQPDLLPEAAE